MTDPDDAGWDDAQRAERGERFYALRKELGLGVEALADELNKVAAALGLPERWTGPKVAKIGKGLQNLTLEDLASIVVYDPQQRSEFWWAFGREKPARTKAGGSGLRHPVVVTDDEAPSLRRRGKRKRTG